MTKRKKCGLFLLRVRKGGVKLQKLYCPICGKLLIKNTDLVIDDPVVMDLDRIKSTDKKVKTITCHNCKRRLRYYIDKEQD